MRMVWGPKDPLKVVINGSPVSYISVMVGVQGGVALTVLR